MFWIPAYAGMTPLSSCHPGLDPGSSSNTTLCEQTNSVLILWIPVGACARVGGPACRQAGTGMTKCLRILFLDSRFRGNDKWKKSTE